MEMGLAMLTNFVILYSHWKENLLIEFYQNEKKNHFNYSTVNPLYNVGVGPQ